MFDSLRLAEGIITAGAGSLDEIIAKYEKEMLPRGIAQIKDGQAMSAIFMAEDSPRTLKEWLTSVGM